MRQLIIALVLASAPAFASEGTGRAQTLVGWSADGERWAVIEDTMGENAHLEIHDRDKIVATFAQDAPGVPKSDEPGHSGFEKIDVATWAATKKYALLAVPAAARTRFASAYDLKAFGKEFSFHDRCSDNGWSLTRKADKVVVREVKAKDDHCFTALGGYASADGKRLLVKLNEQRAWTDQGEYMFEGWRHFVFVELDGAK